MTVEQSPEIEAVLTDEERASLAAQIREDGIGLLDLLDEAKAAFLDSVPRGTFVNPRPMMDTALTRVKGLCSGAIDPHALMGEIG